MNISKRKGKIASSEVQVGYFPTFRRVGMERLSVAEMRRARDAGGNWIENGASSNNNRTHRAITLV